MRVRIPNLYLIERGASLTIKLTDKEYLTFDDVLIVPLCSFVHSRMDVSLKTRLVGDLTIGIPLISANMDTVTELAMAKAMHSVGGMGFIHRFINDPVEHAKLV